MPNDPLTLSLPHCAVQSEYHFQAKPKQKKISLGPYISGSNRTDYIRFIPSHHASLACSQRSEKAKLSPMELCHTITFANRWGYPSLSTRPAILCDVAVREPSELASLRTSFLALPHTSWQARYVAFFLSFEVARPWSLREIGNPDNH